MNPNRFAHYLRPVKRSSQPRALVCFDTETDENNLDVNTIEHTLNFGWAVYCHRNANSKWFSPTWFRFESAVAFWEWLEERCPPKMRLYVYCHNANFDWQVTSMTTLLPSLGWVCATAILNDPPNWFVWRKGAKTLYLLDTFNYWAKPLADIAKRVGLKKLDFPHNWLDRETADRYCRRDVEILLVALQEWYAWLAKHDLGSVAISLAGQAWQAYKHRFMDHPIFIDANVRALDLARNAYYGGRTEAWRVGVDVINQAYVDVNSMYPFVMRNCEYPTKVIGTYRRVTPDELNRWCHNHLAVARVTLETDEPAYPLKAEGKLLFPVGTFDTYLSTPELQHALARGHVSHVHEVALYEKATIFRRFVDELYALRRECADNQDTAGTYFVKIMMNSLYGKFGQRSGFEEIIADCDPDLLCVEQILDLDTGQRYQRRYIAGKVLERGEDTEARESHPAIAAHVTAYARIYLWQLIQRIGSAHITYMDTDGLMVSRAGLKSLEPLLSETELGLLKIEQYVDHAIYYGPKDYMLDGVRKIKGVRRKAVKVGLNTYYQTRFGSLKAATIAAHKGGPLVTLTRKRLARVYTKGRVDSSGTVHPLHWPTDRARALGNTPR